MVRVELAATGEDWDREADADAAVAMNGLSFQGKTLEVSRRMFKNPEYEGLTRTERRKLKAKKSEEKRAQSGGHDHPDHKAGVVRWV
ncbi:hypothetical protein EC957_011805 [Mortierella hygrophila]|uniref:Uncharacterized protein n=1 Tax=Mortierella hygrophila TaxID=979708 RepID=A0A9P6EWB8_9FUNG|nr:hypothetical protein EC957_011805 [Mortierella hygrophila]